MKKRTKILATVGPASDSQESLEALIRAGVNVFRMNFSHGTHAYHTEVLTRIRKAMHNTGLIVGVLQDICGPKIRIGKLKEDFYLNSGDRLEFVPEDVVGEAVETGRYRLSINQNSILAMLKKDDFIYLHDGNIRAKVVEAGDTVAAEVQNSGKLSSNKGVNFPNTALGIDIITPKDEEDIRWGVKHGVDFMAISFVQSADDMRRAREIVENAGGSQELFAKIEKFDAVENVDEILQCSDGLMVARGDLGIEVPYYDVPRIQKALIRKANEMSKPVITATQMLLSMTEKESATRAEISDVANAVLDGTDVVMLSEETAVGHNPVLAVETMVNTIQAAEGIYPYDKFNHFCYQDEMDFIDESAIRLSENLKANAMLALTSSGQSAKKLARYRPKYPIHAITHDERVARLLTMVWGVVPAYMVKKNKLDVMLGEVIVKGLQRSTIDLEGTYVLTAGDPVGVPGTTNSIRILRRNELEFFRASAVAPSAKKRQSVTTESLF